MDKNRVGLPSSFSIDLPSPVKLGDYLDETADLNREPRGNPNTAIEQTVLSQERPSQSSKVVAFEQPRPRKTTRMQINMSPETRKRLSEIIAHIRDFSPQEDTAVSEVIDAIISIHHDALGHLSLGSVRPRGRWGTPTAEAFKHTLARAFEEALSKFQKVKNRRDTTASK